MDELRYSLLYTTLELETTRLEAQEEIQRKEDQITQLKDMLNIAIRERDESRECQRLLMEKLLLLQQQNQPPQQTPPLSGASSIEEETRRGDSNAGISSSDCEESIVSSPMVDPILSQPVLPPPSTLTTTIVQNASEKPLPENGKFLQAVIKAGPLLQTLLLAGPLPQWRHPPPQLNSVEIPPVAIPSTPLPPHILHQDSSAFTIDSINDSGACFNQKKRPLIHYEGSDSCTSTKYQKIALH